jgi:diguanylate cyclase (GGDEF)-like protein/PAS domain S-box-containing protein
MTNSDNNPFTEMSKRLNTNPTKLLVSVFIFTGIFLYLFLYQVQKMSTNANRHNYFFMVLNAAKNINFHITSILSSMMNIVFTKNKEDLTQKINIVNEIETRILEQFEIIFERYLIAPPSIENTRQTLLNSKLIIAETINLVIKNELKEASLITKSKGSKQVAKIQQEILNLIDFAYEQDKFYKKEANVQNVNSMILIILFCISSIGIIFYLFHQFNTRYKKENYKVHNALKWLKVLFDSSPEPMLIVSELGVINLANTRALSFFGYARQKIIGLNVSQLIPKRYQDHHRLVEHSFKHSTSSNCPMKTENKREFFGVKKSREEVAIEISLSFAELNDNKFAITTIRDISDRKIIEKKINRQANYNFLTDTPNRFLSMEKLSQFIIDANREQTKVALLFIDLDNLKNINDSLGHTAGDQVLILAANKFSSCLREGDIIGRLGGDEFIIVMKDFESSVNIANVAKKLIEEFNQPFKYENSELILTTSIGISIYPDDSRNEEELLRFSDIAMYNSKDKGRNQFSFFNNEMQLALNERLAIENEVVYALKRNELTVVYQLQYDLETEELIGFEALLKWKNDKLGIVCPTKFIPIMKSTGLINDVGIFVLDKALAALKNWQINFDSNLYIAVNIYPIQFNNKNLCNIIQGKLNQYHLSNQSLYIEMTEKLLLKESEGVHHIINYLQNNKIGIVLDGFATGYSSLRYIVKYQFVL